MDQQMDQMQPTRNAMAVKAAESRGLPSQFMKSMHTAMLDTVPTSTSNISTTVASSRGLRRD